MLTGPHKAFRGLRKQALAFQVPLTVTDGSQMLSMTITIHTAGDLLKDVVPGSLKSLSVLFEIL